MAVLFYALHSSVALIAMLNFFLEFTPSGISSEIHNSNYKAKSINNEKASITGQQNAMPSMLFIASDPMFLNMDH